MDNLQRLRLTAIILIGASGCGSDMDVSGSAGGNVGFGGAGDIGEFRDILGRGGIPAPETLDPNGFFSEHYIELPPPDCGQPLCLQPSLSVGADWRRGDYQVALHVAMNTTMSPTDIERRPLNLAVVVDTSGSMGGGDRMTFAREGLHRLVDALGPDDRVALVRYSTSAEVIAELSGAEDTETLHAVIDQLVPNGGTNLYDGLELGFAVIANSFDSTRQNRVVLLSDGLATAGITSEPAIINMSNGFIRDGIGITTIGVGDNFNTHLMSGLAEQGAGNFYYLEDAAAIAEVFEKELDYFVTPIAHDVTLTIEAGRDFDAGQFIGSALLDTEGNRATLSLPTVFLASRTSTEEPAGRRGGGSAIVVDLVPRHSNASATATVTLSYRLPGESDWLTQTVSIENPTPLAVWEDQLVLSHQTTAKSYAVYNIYRGLAEAVDQAQYTYNCSAKTLTNLQARAAKWNDAARDDDIAADIELIAMFIANLNSYGADAESCAGLDANGPYGDDIEYGPHGCSTSSSGASGFAPLLLVVGLIWRRRRK